MGTPIALKEKPQAEGRKGNIALDVERPLFEAGSNYDFTQFKTSLMSQPTTPNLPSLHFFDGKSDKDDYEHDSVILTSYPRSGNTLLRAYLEKVMGLVSGSDCDITKKLNVALMNMGLAGEGLVDKRVWVIKTHYPERYGKTKFGAERCILLVRSPLDCITSLFNMVCSGSHDCSISDEDFQRFNALWTEFIEQEISIWKDFHDFWMRAKIPVHIIRYEDIIQRPQAALENLCKFILNVETVEGTQISANIALAVQEKAPEIYKPRKGKVNGNTDKFTENNLLYMCTHAGELIAHLGYSHLFI